MRQSLISLLAFLGTIAVTAAVTVGEAPLSMTVSPHLAFAPAELRVRLGVSPSGSNRTLLVVAESENFYRSSEMPLEGADSPRTVTVQFRGLPDGVYDVSCEVRDGSGRTLAVVRQEVTVLPGTPTR